MYLCRFYATHKSNDQFRRMICYITNFKGITDPNELMFPIFLQYVGYPTDLDEQAELLKPHGNAKKTTRPFTSTAPAVIASIKVSYKTYIFLYT
jgi:hypothetical protein